MSSEASLPFDTTRLGALISTHKVSAWQRIKGTLFLLVIGIPMALWGANMVMTGSRVGGGLMVPAGLALLVWGIVSIVQAVRKGKSLSFTASDGTSSAGVDATAGPWLAVSGLLITVGAILSPGVVIAVIGLFMILLPIWSLAIGIARKGRTGYLFSDGYCYVNANGKPQSARWDEIEKVWVLPTKQNVIVTIQTKDGARQEFGDPWLNQYRDFAHTIETRVADLLLPRAMSDFDKGAELEFGPLRISKLGIICGEEKLSWADVSQVRVGPNPTTLETSVGADLVFRPPIEVIVGNKPRKLGDAAIVDIPNLHVMMTLLKKIDKAVEPYY